MLHPAHTFAFTLLFAIVVSAPVSAQQTDADAPRLTVASRTPQGEARLTEAIGSCVPDDLRVSVTVEEEVLVEISNAQSSLSTRFVRPRSVALAAQEVCRLVRVFSSIPAGAGPTTPDSSDAPTQEQHVAHVSEVIDPWSHAVPLHSGTRLSNPRERQAPRVRRAEVLDPWSE